MADGSPPDPAADSSSGSGSGSDPDASSRSVAGTGQEPGPDAYVTDRRTLSGRVRLQWAVRVVVAAAVAGVVATLAAVRFGIDPRLSAGGALGLAGLGLGWIALRYRAWAYEVREDVLYLQRGVATHRRTVVPYVRIQHVDTSRRLLERALGLSTLVVYTAGSRGADVSIPGLTPAEAADLQTRVKELAIEAEGGDAV